MVRQIKTRCLSLTGSVLDEHTIEPVVQLTLSQTAVRVADMLIRLDDKQQAWQTIIVRIERSMH
jgi:hypothetical protein